MACGQPYMLELKQGSADRTCSSGGDDERSITWLPARDAAAPLMSTYTDVTCATSLLQMIRLDDRGKICRTFESLSELYTDGLL